MSSQRACRIGQAEDACSIKTGVRADVVSQGHERRGRYSARDGADGVRVHGADGHGGLSSVGDSPTNRCNLMEST